MAILDLYKAGVFKLGINHSFAGRKTANQTATQHPYTTDVIRGITPQQVTLKYEGDAARGFIANKTPADRNSSDFNMLDKTNTKNVQEFDPLNTNNDYTLGVAFSASEKKIKGYNSTKTFNGGALTNPKG
jgi:hypothetical protein